MAWGSRAPSKLVEPERQNTRGPSRARLSRTTTCKQAGPALCAEPASVTAVSSPARPEEAQRHTGFQKTPARHMCPMGAAPAVVAGGD